MKRMNLRRIAAILAFFAVLSVVAVSADSSDSYLTQNDPLVSQSYLEKVFKAEMESYIARAVSDSFDGKLNSVSEQMVKPYVDSRLNEYFTSSLVPYINQRLENIEPSSYSASAVKLTVRAGETIRTDGICEVILRQGKAMVVCPAYDSGASDTTDGVELTDGDSLTLNHNVMFSSDNSCGIRAVTDITVYVKGVYSVVTK